MTRRVGELREDKAELLVGSARVEVVWRCGATVSFELASVRVGGGDVLGVLGRERARQGGKSEMGLLLVLRRARVGELRLCNELSMATTRGGEVQGEGEWVQEVAGVPRGAVGEAGGGLQPSSAAGSAGAQRSREGERRKKEAGLVCKF